RRFGTAVAPSLDRKNLVAAGTVLDLLVLDLDDAGGGEWGQGLVAFDGQRAPGDRPPERGLGRGLDAEGFTLTGLAENQGDVLTDMCRHGVGPRFGCDRGAAAANVTHVDRHQVQGQEFYRSHPF
ncbi:MAG: hypothetical protein US75_C0045G0002, partial [Candidatus Woesebacteria bacterium GW2011_GWC1_38_13]